MGRLDNLLDHLDEMVEGFGGDTWILLFDDLNHLYYEGDADGLYEFALDAVYDGIYLFASHVLSWRVTQNGKVIIKIKPKLDTDGRVITP